MKYAALALITLMVWANAHAGPISTGVSGSVSVSPAHPGPQRAGISDTSPMAGTVVQVRRADGMLMEKTITDPQGRFTVGIPAGQYRVEVDVARP